MDKLHNLKSAVITFVGALTGFWGWFGWLLMGWLGCMVLDYVTGTLAACHNGEWSSLIAREGIWHKVSMAFIVLAAGGVDLLLSQIISRMSLGIAYHGEIYPIVLCWYIVTELGSVVENAASMGAPVPEWLRKMLKLSQDAINEEGNKKQNGVKDHDGE